MKGVMKSLIIPQTTLFPLEILSSLLLHVPLFKEFFLFLVVGMLTVFCVQTGIGGRNCYFKILVLAIFFCNTENANVYNLPLACTFDN